MKIALSILGIANGAKACYHMLRGEIDMATFNISLMILCVVMVQL